MSIEDTPSVARWLVHVGQYFSTECSKSTRLRQISVWQIKLAAFLHIYVFVLKSMLANCTFLSNVRQLWISAEREIYLRRISIWAYYLCKNTQNSFYSISTAIQHYHPPLLVIIYMRYKFLLEKFAITPHFAPTFMIYQQKFSILWCLR